MLFFLELTKLIFVVICMRREVAMSRAHETSLVFVHIFTLLLAFARVSEIGSELDVANFAKACVFFFIPRLCCSVTTPLNHRCPQNLFRAIGHVHLPFLANKSVVQKSDKKLNS